MRLKARTLHQFFLKLLSLRSSCRSSFSIFSNKKWGEAYTLIRRRTDKWLTPGHKTQKDKTRRGPHVTAEHPWDANRSHTLRPRHTKLGQLTSHAVWGLLGLSAATFRFTHSACAPGYTQFSRTKNSNTNPRIKKVVIPFPL